MKRINLTIVSLCVAFLSCVKDSELYLEDVVLSDQTELQSLIPCNFDLNDVTPNETVNINCDYDLGGNTIVLPENVTLLYDGGTITNGSLILKNGLISGELLNISLDIAGSGELLSTTFSFDPNKWGITQGRVQDAVALTNKENMNISIALVKHLGAEIFEIDNIDAYFDVQANNYNDSTQESIILPSDFHFKMSDNTHLRVQPNAKPAYALISALKQQNVTTTGGHLWGDRYEHIYATGTDGDTHEYGYGIYYRGVINGIVENVELREHTGDGFIIQSSRNRNDDGSEKPGEVYSKNIRLANCIIDKNRRNNISLTDVDGMIIENNIITNGGDGGPWSSSEGYNYKGVLPRYNIDLEAINILNDDGTLRLTEIVQNVIIRNNEFTGAFNGDIDLYKCWDVEIYENTFDSYIANVASYNITIYQNTFVNTLPNRSDRKFAMAINERIRADGSDYNTNYVIYENTITGYETGMNIGGTGQEVYNNTINECLNGILLINGHDNYIHDNIITSDVAGSSGYFSLPGAGHYSRNVLIENEIVRVKEFGLLLQSANLNETTHRLTFDNCSFSAYKGVELRESNNITIRNSTYTDYTNKNSTNIILENNNN